MFYESILRFFRVLLLQYLRLDLTDRLQSLLHYFAKTFYPAPIHLGYKHFGEMLIWKLREIVWFGRKVSMPVEEFVEDALTRIDHKSCRKELEQLAIGFTEEHMYALALRIFGNIEGALSEAGLVGQATS